MYNNDFNFVTGVGTINNDPTIAKSWKETDMFIRFNLKELPKKNDSKSLIIPFICYIEENDLLKDQLKKGVKVFYRGRIVNSHKNNKPDEIAILGDSIRVIVESSIENLNNSFKNEFLSEQMPIEPGIGLEDII
jgi:hypothetical protein